MFEQNEFYVTEDEFVQKYPGIERFVQDQNPMMQRLVIVFKNHTALVCMRGHGTRGANDGNFEIVPVGTNGQPDRTMIDVEDGGTNVSSIGNCDREKVLRYVEKMSKKAVDAL